MSGAFPRALLLSLAAWAAAARPSSAENAATVDGHLISTQQVEAAFKRTSVSRKQLTPEQEKLYRRHVLNLLIDEYLVERYLDQEQIPVDEKKVDEHVAALKKQLEGKNQSLEEFLAKVEIDEDQMRRDIGQIYRWLDLVESQATEATLRKYFAANQGAFDGSEVRASHILVKVAPNAGEAERKAARDRIAAIRAQLASGTSFADAARAHSDCPSKAEGGDLGFFPRKDVMTEPFAAAAFALPPGQVSEIVETEFGYHLIAVTDKKPGRPIVYEDVADEVKVRYATDLRTSVVARMRASADIKILR